ncbi:MAG TPA: hypothetical protein VNE58_16335 [Casimicrobiaceae bacterium]|nr:hypothetical protein [Casimicrobiaceae bacterium]
MPAQNIDLARKPIVGDFNVDTEFLCSDLIEALPASPIVLELYEKEIDDRTLARPTAADDA